MPSNEELIKTIERRIADAIERLDNIDEIQKDGGTVNHERERKRLTRQIMQYNNDRRDLLTGEAASQTIDQIDELGKRIDEERTKARVVSWWVIGIAFVSAVAAIAAGTFGYFDWKGDSEWQRDQLRLLEQLVERTPVEVDAEPASNLVAPAPAIEPGAVSQVPEESLGPD